jgi:hypothetical protein
MYFYEGHVAAKWMWDTEVDFSAMQSIGNCPISVIIEDRGLNGTSDLAYFESDTGLFDGRKGIAFARHNTLGMIPITPILTQNGKAYSFEDLKSDIPALP